MWVTAADLAEACRRTSFVTGLEDGSLSQDRWTDYVAQDAFFLGEFARAYALGYAKAGTRAEQATWKALMDGVEAELGLHRTQAEVLGIDLAQVEPRAATLAYTDFLRATAFTEAPPQISAAMAPCMRLYAWLGQTLAPTARGPYRTWVDTYADPGFHSLAVLVEALLTSPGAVPERQHRLYRQAMALELGFFLAS